MGMEKGVILRRVCFAEAHGALAKGQPNLGTCPNEGHGPIDAGCTGGKGSRPLGFATPSSEAEVNLPLDVQDVLEESMLRGLRSEKKRPAGRENAGPLCSPWSQGSGRG